MKTVLSLQSQLDLAGLEESRVTTFSMFFQVSILDMLFSATKCLQIAFLSNFGSPLGPWGVSNFLIFRAFLFSFGPCWGPNASRSSPKSPQNHPKPPFLSLFHRFPSRFW